MKLVKNNENKETVKLPMSGKVKKGFRFYCVAVMATALVVDVYKRQTVFCSTVLAVRYFAKKRLAAF